MTFDLTTILLCGLLAVLYSAFLPARQRGWALFVVSIVAIYWLQSQLAIRYVDFILPTTTIALTVVVWYFTRKADDEAQRVTWREDQLALGLLVLIVVGLSLMRFIQPEYRLTASRPPNPLFVVVGLASIIAASGALWRVTRTRQNRILDGLIVLVIVLFVALKAEPLAVTVSAAFRSLVGQDTTLASVTDLGWLGFSYVAFRLIHTLRDRQMGVLPALSLREFTTYVLFFPAFISGPIDRAERFVKDFRALPEMAGLDGERFVEGTRRIVIGVFKKFVIADTLALGMALNATNAEQATSTFGLWLLLYGYALRLFFDFSGYTDIAIGLAILLGIKLPENFDRPYLKTSITTFWQSWHITLSNWARFYVFTPVSRALLKREPKPSPLLTVLAAQLATMIVIGLWHGVTVNFLVWGAWHGVGLFIHKQWTDRTRKFYRRLKDRPTLRRAEVFGSWFLTFHFVVLGWVWFALPTFEQSIQVFAGLLGF